MSPEKMTPEQIAKVAEDVRTIERFQNESLNHGFDSNLISATVIPKNVSSSVDWPLISFSVFLVLFICLIAPRFVTEISSKLEELLMVFSLLVGTLVVFAAHLKFKDKAVTIILSIGLVIVVTIGFGVLTPKEAINEAKEIVK